MKRSMLFCPAKDETMMVKAQKYEPDCIIFDLEDAVAVNFKEEARNILKNVMLKNTFKPHIYVRINAANSPFFDKDVEAVIKSGIKNIRLAMCETTDHVVALDKKLTQLEKQHNLVEGSVKIQCSLETPLGVYNAMQIGKTSPRVESFSFGSEDYTNCLGVSRTKDVKQFLYARSHLALCANILGIGMFDAVFSDLNDMEGFEKETNHIISLGFTGKSCVHPKQVEVVNRCFTPSEEEIEKAEKIIAAAAAARKESKGVIQLNGKMIDGPIIEKAQKILARAGRM